MSAHKIQKKQSKTIDSLFHSENKNLFSANILIKQLSLHSIGTNDLTQYTLAIDRQNTKLDDFYDAHHPAILAMIRMVVENAHAEGIWAGICGELGADTTLTEEFLKMGVDELSVSAGKVLAVRRVIRETRISQGLACCGVGVGSITASTRSGSFGDFA